MIRFLLAVAANVLVAALALVVAGAMLEEVTVHLGGFFVAVGVFAIAQSVLGPIVVGLARRYATALLGGIGLVSTFLALWVATLFPGGIEIRGAAWVLAPLIVWIITAVGGQILIGLVIERMLARREKRKRLHRA